MNKMDLATLDTQKGSDEGFALELTHPKTGEKIGAVINVLGVDSHQYQAKFRELQRKRLNQINKNPRRLLQTPEQTDAEALELLAAVTTGWNGVVLDGKDLAFSEDAARELYARFAWIREQVDQAVGDRANFLPQAATIS